MQLEVAIRKHACLEFHQEQRVIYQPKSEANITCSGRRILNLPKDIPDVPVLLKGRNSHTGSRSTLVLESSITRHLHVASYF